MATQQQPQQISVVRTGAVATVVFSRPPTNYFDDTLIIQIHAALAEIDNDPSVRATVLASEGKHFCAGADLSGSRLDPREFYERASRLFDIRKPIVAAVQGGAIGGGLGLAVMADFRFAALSTGFEANFVTLGVHPGFGLTHTLPRLIGQQAAADMLLTGRRIPGAEAVAIGLADKLVPEDQLRSAAVAKASELACAAPLAVEATRETLRKGLADAVRTALAREAELQIALSRTRDFAEGVTARKERRIPVWTSR